MTDNGENVIEVSHLMKNYGVFNAVYDVSFAVRRGEIFALLGPNGAGKTTVVEILELLKHPTKGFISILGSTVVTGVDVGNEFLGNPFPEVNLDFRRIKEKIGVLPQSFAAFELLTVRENLDYFARMYPSHVGLNRLIEELGLEDKRNSLFKDLSGGLKQRVGIALALVNDPEIIFLDEPSSGLDPKARRDLWEAIKALKGKGRTVVLTTHYMDEAYYLADRICILHKGTVIAEGTPEDLINAYGGGNTLVIRGCGAETKEALAGEFPGSVTAGSEVLIGLPEADSVEIVWKAAGLLKSGSYSYRELYVKKSTLDDVFLRLTGEQLATGPRDAESIDAKVFQAIVRKIAGSE